MTTPKNNAAAAALTIALCMALGAYSLRGGSAAQPDPEPALPASQQPRDSSGSAPIQDERNPRAAKGEKHSATTAPTKRTEHREATVVLPPEPAAEGRPRFANEDPQLGRLVQGMRGAATRLDPQKEAAASDRWSKTKTREDSLLVKQAQRKGLSPQRSRMMARILKRYRASRQTAVNAVIAGRITDAEFGRRARSAGRMRDAALRGALGPSLYESMDWGAAIAAVAMGAR
jgi:hypothetical protein